MSMINDALRRASSAAKSTSPTPDSAAAPLSPPPPSLPAAQQGFPPPPPPPMPAAGTLSPQPFAGFDGGIPAPPLLRARPVRKKSVLPAVLITFFVFCLAGAAGAFFWQKNHRLLVSAIEKPDQEPTDSEFVAALLGDEKAREKIADEIKVTNAPTPVTSTPPISKQAPAVAANPAPVPSGPRSTVKFPPLRLQSIFYRPSNPSVIINGKTLFVSDDIDGVNVADIQPASVTLVLSGQTNVLTLR